MEGRNGGNRWAGAWTGLRNSLAASFTGWIFGFVSLVVLGVAGYLLWREQPVLNRELRSRGFLTASHLGQASLYPILREDDHALFKLLRTP